MLLARSEHPSWLSNAYLVADGAGGHGVLVDANGVAPPLLERIEREEITVTHILLTHEDADHVAGLDAYRERFRAPVLAAAGDVADEAVGDGDSIRSGGLEISVLHTPGHTQAHLAFVVNGTDCLTGDLLFRGSVGGTGRGGPSAFDDLKRSIMERVLALPPQTRLHPGHSEPSSVAEELESNPFVRVWRGLDAEGSERCRVAGEEATLVVWARDYDGGHKAWVRFRSGGDAIVGGSQVDRG